MVYSHDCGDLGDLWSAVLAAGLPVRAVNAEGFPPRPGGRAGLDGRGGDDLRAAAAGGAYPTVLLVQDGRIMNAWEGTFSGKLE